MTCADSETARFQQWWMEAQWEPLMASLAPRLRALLLAQGADADLADDITQETVVRCWRQTTIPENPLAFASTIARNLLRDHAKSARVRLCVSPTDAEIALERCVAPVEDPLEAIIAEADRGLLRQALRSLPDKVRRPLVLAAFHQRTSVELAAQFGGRPDAMKVRLSRARKLLVKALAGASLPKRRGPNPRWCAPVGGGTPLSVNTAEIVATELPTHVTAAVILRSAEGTRNIGTFCVTPAEWAGSIGRAIRAFDPMMAGASASV